jgi:hypothetical protein
VIIRFKGSVRSRDDSVAGFEEGRSLAGQLASMGGKSSRDGHHDGEIINILITAGPTTTFVISLIRFGQRAAQFA